MEETIGRLTKGFKCGGTVIASRALDNGLINYALYEKTARLAIAYDLKKKSNSGGRIDSRFLKMLINSVTAGRTPYTDAYRLTNSNRFTFEKLTNHAGDAVL